MRRLAVVCALACVLAAFAVKPQVRWLETEYDFGVIKEAAGPATGSVRFVNDSPDDIFVARVRPTCGCTDAHGPEDAVAPGDTARIVFTYDPAGRPGAFRKSIRVVFVGADTPDEIGLKGTVIAKPGSIDSKYPVKAGALNLTMDNIHFGDVALGDSRYLFIAGFNNTSQTLRPVITDAPGKAAAFPVDVVMVPDTVAPGEIVTLGFYLHTSATAAANKGEIFGPFTAKKRLCVGDECIDITLDAEILPAIAESLADEINSGAARLAVSPETIDLGNSLRRDKPAEFTLDIANEGDNPLTIKRIYSDDEMITPVRYPVTLKKGKRGKATLQFSPAASAEAGEIVTGFVTIISNDPLRPVVRIKFAGQYK